uniref:hypothetical protein n=1 Tax=Dermacoccus nishinomiyaensis TaxID=1274 RepID=UPI001642B0FE
AEERREMVEEMVVRAKVGERWVGVGKGVSGEGVRKEVGEGVGGVVVDGGDVGGVVDEMGDDEGGVGE